MITLDKTKDFENFMSEVKYEFHMGNIVRTINEIRAKSIDLGYDIEGKKYVNFCECCLKLIQTATNHVYDENIHQNFSSEMSKISDFLSFPSKSAAMKYLTRTPYIEENFMYNLLEFTFYALVILDSQIYRRFKVAYTLWQHSVEFGVAGYSEKFGKIYPYYITYFVNKIFIVDPIKGEVKGFERVGHLRGKKIVGLLTGTLEEKRVALATISDDIYVPLVEESLYGTLTEVQPTHLAQSDRKRAERERKREKGLKVEETPWLTTALDTVNGSSYNIRTHSFIALMAHQLESMKYGVMENSSIFTIDHINKKHEDNKIDNLQLLTRKANDQKKNKPNSFYFDYFGYWEKQIKQAKINQENYNFRRNAD